MPQYNERDRWAEEALYHGFILENELASYEVDVFQPKILEVVTCQLYLFQRHL